MISLVAMMAMVAVVIFTLSTGHSAAMLTLANVSFTSVTRLMIVKVAAVALFRSVSDAGARRYRCTVRTATDVVYTSLVLQVEEAVTSRAADTLVGHAFVIRDDISVGADTRVLEAVGAKEMEA